jgi:hypothetical protein
MREASRVTCGRQGGEVVRGKAFKMSKARQGRCAIQGRSDALGKDG